jgi:hypothetical protein
MWSFWVCTCIHMRQREIKRLKFKCSILLKVDLLWFSLLSEIYEFEKEKKKELKTT